jgi:hypothetical protein
VIACRPRFSARGPSASTIAAAASFSPGALPTVMVPFVYCRGELDKGEIRDRSDFCQFDGFYPSH